jgi:hypothetical protein
MEMNEIEKQADDLVYKKEYGIIFKNVRFYFKLCFLYSLITFFLILFFAEDTQTKMVIVLCNVVLYSLPYIRKIIKTYELKDDNEYQLAKQISEKYKKRIKKEKEKIKLEEITIKEQEKVKRIMEFRNYLNEKVEK